MAKLAFVSRSIDVAAGGGIGAYISALSRLMAQEHEVILVSVADNLGRMQAAVEGFPNIRLLTVDVANMPDGGTYFDHMHAYSAEAWRVLQKEFREHGPADYIEFPDYLGEGAVTIQARATGEPLLANTVIAVRIHTTSELAATLNGSRDTDFRTRLVHDLERYSLKFADRVLYGGGEIESLYQHFYGADQLAPTELVRHPTSFPAESTPARNSSEPFRMLYIGRAERRKGIYELAASCAGLPEEDWSLTIVAGDTRTGPAETSMRAMLELATMGDDRIELRDSVPHEQIPALIGEHDAVVVPSRWECWPNTALEALAHNRPVLAAPVGGLVDLVIDGETGMLSQSNDVESIREMIVRACRERESLREMSRAGKPVAHYCSIADPERVASAYSRLASERPGDGPRRNSRPLVSVVIPYFQMFEYVERTVKSLFEQSYRPIEVLLVNDGAFGHEDKIVFELADRYPITLLTRPNGGLGSARNFGIGQARGRYVLPLDADNMICEGFIERAVDVLEREPETAYVTAWTNFIDEDGVRTGHGYRPISNFLSTIDIGNVAGDAIAVMRRDLFGSDCWYSEELISYEDWYLYRELRLHGQFGHAIPEPLLDYRVRSDSMLREDGQPNDVVLEKQMHGLVKEEEIKWVHSNA